MRQPEVIAAMAEAALLQGASGVRLESPEHITAVRRRCPEALIIGLWKRSLPGSSVYITPRWQEIRAVWAAGADVVALDATERLRPGEEDLETLVNRARTELGAPLMADVDSLAAGLRAAALGCSWVGTTLYGYTEATAGCPPPAWELLAPLRQQLPSQVALICEGGHRQRGRCPPGPGPGGRCGGGGHRHHRHRPTGGGLCEGAGLNLLN